MSWARAFAFNIAFVAWTLVLGTIGLPFLLTPRPAAMAFGRFWAQGVLVLLRVLVGLDSQISGVERIPAGGCIVAMKHQSAWDALIIPIVLGDPAVVVKRELRFHPPQLRRHRFELGPCPGIYVVPFSREHEERPWRCGKNRMRPRRPKNPLGELRICQSLPL